MKQRSLHLVILGTFLCAAFPSSVVAQTTVNAGSTAAAAGSIAAVPISIVLAPGTSCATLQFNLTIVPGSGAPALGAPVTFASLVGLPTLNRNNGAATVLVAWISSFSPLLTGMERVGTLNVPIPASALAGQTYDVTVVNPSGTTDGESDLPMTSVNGSIDIVPTPPTPTLTATPTLTFTPTSTPPPTLTPTLTPPPPPPPTSTNTAAPILVCDVSPSTGNDPGQFGNTTINNSDIDAIFKASLLGPPPADSARFSAMDAVAADTPPVCGGDGAIKNNDVVACFRRSLLPTEPMYVRTLAGETCTSAQQ